MSIPMSEIINVTPGVLGVPGDAISLNGVVLTLNEKVLVNQVTFFNSVDDVSDFFGPDSEEKKLAQIYFAADTHKTRTPGRLYFWRYSKEATPASLLSAPFTDDLTALKLLNGNLSITVDGKVETGQLDFSSITSFSLAAQKIGEILNLSASFDSISKRFTLQSNTKGPQSSLSYASSDKDNLADQLGLTASTKASLTPKGESSGNPESCMNALINQTTNWASFTVSAPVTTEENLQFSIWANQQNARYIHVGVDQDPTILSGDAPDSWGAQCKSRKFNGVIPIFGDSTHALFVMGVIAAINFDETNGRKSLAFKSQASLTPSISNKDEANKAISNGYNFYGAYATANEDFNWFYPGTMPGEYNTIAVFVNQIWLNAQLQSAIATLFEQSNSIAFNKEGDALIESACLDVLIQGVKNGVIRQGILLSESQKQQMQNALGFDASSAIQAKGYVLVPGASSASAQQRQQGKISPILYYTDGGDIIKVEMASIAVL